MAPEPAPGPVHTTEAYGLGDAPADGTALPWATVVEWLTAARNYWVCTTRPTGARTRCRSGASGSTTRSGSRPTRRRSRPRTCIARPDVVIHLESGDEVCVLEGRAVKVEDPDALADFDDRYDAKYQVRPSSMGEAAGVYLVKPATALVWTEAEFPTTATRFTF